MGRPRSWWRKVRLLRPAAPACYAAAAALLGLALVLPRAWPSGLAASALLAGV